MNNDYYRGQGGEAYLTQRSTSIDDRVQALRSTLFADLSMPHGTILDFGCGTGGIVARLDAARRVGVEVSTAAAEVARSRGIEVFEALDAMPDDMVDVAISFHAIEHVDHPLDVLRAIARVVKPGGRIRLIVPCETPWPSANSHWHENAYQHLHTWTPLLFGNLAQRAGYSRIQSRLEPMPTTSRFVRIASLTPGLGRVAGLLRSLSQNRLNVVLDAAPGKR